MSMPAANASIAHLLIDATIPYPDLDPVLHALIYIYRLPQRHSHSGLAVAGGRCSLGARAGSGKRQMQLRGTGYWVGSSAA